MSYANIQQRLRNGQTVLLDGPMNSELVRRGVRWRKHGLLTDTAAVQQLHEEYVAAGADVLRTNTFQLNPKTYLNVFRNASHQAHIGAPGLADLVPKLLRTSVQLAAKARAKRGKTEAVAIAGMLSPLQHCYRPDMVPPFEDAQREHEAMARVFAEEKVDFIIAESMNTISEAKAALAAGRAAGLPVWVSFVLGPEGELLSREPLAQAIKEMESAGAEAVLVSNSPPEDVGIAISRMKGATKLPYGGFAHAGKFSPPSWKFDFFPQFTETETWPPDRYTKEAKRWRESGATIFGSCCGTGPAHIAALSAWLHANGRSGH
ncbi:MAG: homocysteine S-methyltransferase family protein [Acidobacteria bacterium]|nr:homocysteine S-methyltransferase family protein [Acidobacteriota bacterium]MCL5288742.1 homocysteine S-methyltransferase family protein [Acidobacteriota bacterium]